MFLLLCCSSCFFPQVSSYPQIYSQDSLADCRSRSNSAIFIADRLRGRLAEPSSNPHRPSFLTTPSASADSPGNHDHSRLAIHYHHSLAIIPCFLSLNVISESQTRAPRLRIAHLGLNSATVHVTRAHLASLDHDRGKVDIF